MPLSSSSSPPKRPSAIGRTSSTNSISKVSPSGKARSHKAYVAGPARLHTRNPSYSKTLNKLKNGDEEASSSKSQKKKAQTPSSSPSTAHVKRNSSTVSLPRVGSKANVRRNNSNVSLKRNSSHTHVQKANRPTTPLKKNHSRGSDLDKLGQAEHRFLLDDEDGEDGDGEDDDDEWTEESASQSPSVTRQSPSSRRASGKNTPKEDALKQERPQAPTPTASAVPTDGAQDRQQQSRRPAGGSEQRLPHSRPPDADVLISRLLKRNSSSKLLPQVSSVSATGTPGTHTPPTLIDSQGETLAGSSLPENGISRFINAPSSLSGSTLQIQNSLVQAQAAAGASAAARSRTRARSSSPRGTDAETLRRIKSSGNLESGTRPTATPERPTTPHSGRSPPSYTVEPAQRRRGNMTQLRMDLWRGRDAVEPPHGPPPSILDRLPVGDLPAEERRSRQWDKAEAEMTYLRRFRNPLVDAARRSATAETARRRRDAERPRPKSSRASIAEPEPARSSIDDRGRRPPSRPGPRSVHFDVGIHPADDHASLHRPNGLAVEDLLRGLWAGGDMEHAGDG